MKRAALLLLAMSLSLASGCGTMADALAGPTDDHLYYRGVRMDVAGIKKGLPIMALDMPFSAFADTLMVPAIAFHQMTDPPGTQHKSALHVATDEMAKTMTNEVMVPMAAEMAKATAEMQKQQASPASQ
jgi:uncharacterized protein YceK